MSRIGNALRSLAEDMNPRGSDRDLAKRKYRDRLSATEEARRRRVNGHRQEVRNWGRGRRRG